MDAKRALVTYFAVEGPLAQPANVDFEYESRCGDSTETHLVELLVEPRRRVPTVEPRGPVARVVVGQPRNIQLRHDRSCPGGVAFRITRAPGQGRLGPIQPMDPERALVTYFPASGLTHGQRIDFEYASRCGTGEEKPHEVELLVEPRGQEQPLDRIEVTVNRIDLAHCRELWFGDSALGPVLRPPSIYDVWKAIKPQLEPDEGPKVKEVFDRIAGGHGRP
jgi:hypothetical protein